MKMMYNGTPIKSLNVKHFEVNTNDCDMIASDLQAGKTAVARGKKIIGTGKSFEFAYYGRLKTNSPQHIPNDINIIEVASVEYPVQLSMSLSDMKNNDFSVAKNVADIIIDSETYPISVQAINNILTMSCEKTVYLQLFYGKDNYV